MIRQRQASPFPAVLSGAIGIVALASLTFVSNSALGQETTIDFEDQPPNTTVRFEYQDRGVVFPNSAFVEADSAARSGTRVLRSLSLADEFDSGPLVIGFTSGQSSVSFFAGTPSSGAVGTLRAFDANGSLVDQDGPRPIVEDVYTTPFGVSTATPTIRRVELDFGTSFIEGIDDLTIVGMPPPPPPPPPSVVIEQPADGVELDTSSILLEGTVTGDTPVFARVRVEVGRPPDSLAQPFESPLPLSGSGSEHTFSQSLANFLGAMRITVEAETGGGSHSDSVSIVNLPQAIFDRYAAASGATTLGALRYADRERCTIAVYEQGAIAAEGSTTRLIRGDIFAKWFAERDQGAPFSHLGCPTSEEREVTGGAIAQDFAEGRIYAGLPTGTHYVPAVFVNAMEALRRHSSHNAEQATGVPIADPTESSGAMQTWLFQQFRRPDMPFLLPSTLEIRGNPPVLYVQRQGGDLSGLFGIDITPSVATISERFACEDLQGPCAVLGPPLDKCCEGANGSDPDCENVDLQLCTNPIEDAGNRFCDGREYRPYRQGSPEWAPVEGHYVQTPAMGFARSFEFAAQDNPFTHECIDRDQIRNIVEVLLSPIETFVKCPLNFGGAAVNCYPCDWNLHLNLLRPYQHLRAGNTLLDVEWEWWWSKFFFTVFPARTAPEEGDLIFTSGRWIIDCGHDSFNSEIHPPSVLVSMRTAERDGHDATQANIWVNAVYSGDPVEFEISPPPRPSPAAILHVEKPTDDTAAVGLSVTRFVPSLNDVGVRFTAARAEANVTDAGEMEWGLPRTYYGVWYVYWSEP